MEIVFRFNNFVTIKLTSKHRSGSIYMQGKRVKTYVGISDKGFLFMCLYSMLYFYRTKSFPKLPSGVNKVNKVISSCEQVVLPTAVDSDFYDVNQDWKA